MPTVIKFLTASCSEESVSATNFLGRQIYTVDRRLGMTEWDPVTQHQV